MKFSIKSIALAGSILISSSCSHNIKHYENNKPTMNFKDFFSHKLIANGIIYDFFGRIDSRIIMKSQQISFDAKANKAEYKQSMFNVDKNENKEMSSYAIFDDKNISRVVYKDDMMVSEGIYEQSGNAAHVRYDLKAGKYVLSCDDWLFMIDENNAMNQIKCKKFGITVATIVMHISKNEH